MWCPTSDPHRWAENVTPGCYLGGSDTACPGPSGSKIGWVGGRRSAPVPAAPAGRYASPEFDDGSWDRVDAPHDFVIEHAFSSDADDNGQHGYLPRDKPGWYRKRFAVPARWLAHPAAVVWLTFHGVFHTTRLWLDGTELALSAGSLSGYTSFTAALPRALLARSQFHVLALRADASFGSGHWYEGGGIYRDCFITVASPPYIIDDGLFARAGYDTEKATATVIPSAEIVPGVATAAAETAVRFVVYDPDGVRAAGPSTPVTVTPATDPSAVVTVVAREPIGVPTAEPWSPQNPALYTVVAEVLSGGTVVDTVNVTTGFRKARFYANRGFELNGARFVLRGFSDHNNMAGVGAAVPTRLNLYRAQMLRAVGGNTWRFSHNPGDPRTFEVLDRLGVLSWDENRDYGKFQAQDMRDMVRSFSACHTIYTRRSKTCA